MDKKVFSIELGGKTLEVEFNNLAERAHGSCIVRLGNSVILATAVMSKHKKEGADFLPLQVEYEEKFYASGQILGSRFMRREGKPSDDAILTSRIIDRTIRPLFDQWIRNEIQVIVSVLSMDEYDADILGILGASLALGTSPIPWNGPVGGIRIARKSGTTELIVNPSFDDRENHALDFELIACGRQGKLNMIELGGKEINEDTATEALILAEAIVKKLQTFQEKIISELGKKKISIPQPETPKEIKKLFAKNIEPVLSKFVFSSTPGDSQIETLRHTWLEIVDEKYPDDVYGEIPNYLFEEVVNSLIHEQAIATGRRADGRKADEIRPLHIQAGGVSETLHGSGIFYRGQTHIFSALTLGGPNDAQVIEGMETATHKRFMHHYNFPPFSTGETGKAGGLNRRMVGHGALAEKALIPVIPAKEIFPYTIRIVSEAFTSNGSTSMASVCGGTIALMDAGVPILRPVAGISVGVMIKDETTYKLLTDLQGPEDHYGDMDFKVAGTREGITAVQMDVKVKGISISILKEAFEKANIARKKILDEISLVIKEPRKNISSYAPKILTCKIKTDQIGMIIGPGGKTINNIKDTTKVEGIDVDDDGTVFITGKHGSAEKALEMILGMTHEYKVGEKFTGVVVKLVEFGAFVKIASGTEGLVHASEIASFKVDNVHDYLKEGDKVPVIIKEIDEKKRLNLSIKEADKDFIKKK
ncbi:MAG: polyribonucleotide nucleotidyltransferase [Patescibacteria group bacterium]